MEEILTQDKPSVFIGGNDPKEGRAKFELYFSSDYNECIRFRYIIEKGISKYD